MAMSPTVAPCPAAAQAAPASKPATRTRESVRSLSMFMGVSEEGGALQVEAQLGVIGALRVGVERPVVIVVQIVDPCRDRPRARDPVLGAQVDDEELAEPGEGEAVRVGVVELAELPARVAHAD